MMTFLSVLQVFAAILLIASVLLQPAKGDAALGASSQSLFGNAGATSFLFKITMWCAFFIMASSLLVARYNASSAKKSVFDTLPATSSAPQNSAPAAPATDPVQNQK